MLCPQRSEPLVSLQEHPELLGLLQDDSFREALAGRPVETLGRYGIRLEAQDVPDSVRLPEVPESHLPGPRGILENLWAGLV